MAGLGKLFLGVFYSIFFVLIIAMIIYFFRSKNAFLGPILILCGGIPLIPLLIRKTKLAEIKPGFVFGVTDNGILAITTLIGADLFGVLGAILGGLVGNSFTDGIAGAAEGFFIKKSSKIDSLASSLGKMSGCLIGAGIVLFIAWTVL